MEKATTEQLQVLLAWTFGDLSEGQAMRALALDRVALRSLREQEISAGLAIYDRAWRPQGKVTTDGE